MREDEVGNRVGGVSRHLAKDGDRRQEQRTLDDAAPGREARGEREQASTSGDDHQCAAEVADPPGPHDLEERAGLDDAGERRRDRSDSRADQRPERERDEQCEDAADALER